jgi:hypothetical protein
MKCRAIISAARCRGQNWANCCAPVDAWKATAPREHSPARLADRLSKRYSQHRFVTEIAPECAPETVRLRIPDSTRTRRGLRCRNQIPESDQ